MAIFVGVGEDQSRVVLEAVEHAVPMVSVDVHVGDALEPVALAQIFDRHTAIVEYTESRGSVPRRVM